MKYEEWIKYEQLRQRQTNLLSWVMLPPEPAHPAPETKSSSLEETNRAWTMVVQIFNSKRI